MENREIKFRAWDGEKIVSPDYVDRKGKGHWVENSIPTISNILMQYTGLKDKQGKEIYEGDIVSWTRKEWVDLEDEKNGYRDKTDISSIEYSGHSFWIKGESFGWEGEDLWNWNEIEVIGNLFETPELLTPNK